MQPRKPHRILQVNALLREQFATIINRELELPEGSIITVTSAKTSRDLRHAKIGISIYPTKQVEPLFLLIRKNLKNLQYLVHQTITLKYAPKIFVYLDTSQTRVQELESALNRIKQREIVDHPTVE